MPLRPLPVARRFGARTAAVILSGALAAAVMPPAAEAATGLVTHPAAYVDPLIGTANGGNTFPGATLPYGMIG